MQARPQLSRRARSNPRHAGMHPPQKRTAFAVRSAAAAIAAILVPAGASLADSGTWLTPGSGTWDDMTNWNSGTIADGSLGTADFSQVSLAGDATVTLASPRTIGNLSFGNTAAVPANSWVLDNGGNSSNTLTLSGSPIITVNALGAGQSASINAVIGGSNGLTKAGPGVLSITATATYGGGTTVSGGTLREVGYVRNFDTVNIASGGTLEIVAATDLAIQGGNYTGGGTLKKTGAGALNIGNGWYGGGTVALSSGALVDVEGGTLVGSNTSQGNWDNNQASLYVAGGATFNGNDHSMTFDAINGAGNLTGLSWSSGASTLTVGVANGSGTFSGSFSEQQEWGTASLSITKSGTGTQSFTGQVNYSGNTVVNGGKLYLGGGGLPGNGNYTVAGGGTLEMNTGSGGTYPDKFNMTLSGAGTIVKSGSGQLVFNRWQGDNPLFTVAMSAGGMLDVEGGKLQVSDYNTTTDFSNNLGSLKIGPGGIFDALNNNNVIVDALTGSGTYQAGYYGARMLTVGVANGSGTFSGTIQGNGNDGYANVILTKIGTGTETLTGNVTLQDLNGTPAVEVHGGALVLSPTSGAIGTSNSDIRVGLTAGDTATLAQTSGTVSARDAFVGGEGVGSLLLSGGAFNIYHGLYSSQGGASAATIAVSGSAQLNFFNNSGFVAGSYNNQPTTINQTGGLVAFYSDAGSTLGGTGSFLVNGDGTYTYNLAGGTLAVPLVSITNAAFLGGGTLLANFNGGTLQTTADAPNLFSGFSSTNIALNVQAGGAVIDTNGHAVTISQPFLHGTTTSFDGGLAKQGLGILTLPGTSTYSGTTTVTAGTLDVTGQLTATPSVALGTSATLVVDAPAALPSTVGITGSGSTSNVIVNQNQTVASIRNVGMLTVPASTTLTISHDDQATTGGMPTHTSSITTLALNANGTLDLTNNGIVILDTTSLGAVQSLIAQAAHNSGGHLNWDQPGITSSNAAADPGGHAIGYALASTLGSTSFNGISFSDAVVARYTLIGDTDLNGVVGLNDYTKVVLSLGKSGAVWTDGNFDYSGTIGLSDYTKVVLNAGRSDGQAIYNASGPSAAQVKASALTLHAAPAVQSTTTSTDVTLLVNPTNGRVTLISALQSGQAVITAYTINSPSGSLVTFSTDSAGKYLGAAIENNPGVFYKASNQNTYNRWTGIKNVSTFIGEGFAHYTVTSDSTWTNYTLGTSGYLLGNLFKRLSSGGTKDLVFQWNDQFLNTYTSVVTYVGVPEPTAVSLVAIGAMGLLARRRRSSR